MLTINDISHVFINMEKDLTATGYKPHILHFTFSVKNLQPLRLIRTVISVIRAPFVYINYGLFAFLPRILGTPYVVHCHGCDVRANLSNNWRGLTLFGLRGARWLFYSTPDLADCMPEDCKARSSFLPNPISDAIFTRTAEVATARDGAHVFFISKQDNTKGSEHFAAIARDFLDDPRIARVSMFSHGTAQSKCIIQHPKVRYLPPLSYEEMISAIDDCDIAIGQLCLGVMGMTELEVMARGKPLIMPFHYDHAYASPPPLVNVKDPSGVADAVRQLLDDPVLTASRGQACREWVARFHATKNVALQLAKRLKESGFRPQDIRFE